MMTLRTWLSNQQVRLPLGGRVPVEDFMSPALITLAGLFLCPMSEIIAHGAAFVNAACVFVGKSMRSCYSPLDDTGHTKRKERYMTQESLAMRLRVLRAERALSLTEAAERAGIQRQTLALLERGGRHPHEPTLAKIAKGYGVPVDELLEEPVPAGKAEAPPEQAGQNALTAKIVEIQDTYQSRLRGLKVLTERWETRLR